VGGMGGNAVGAVAVEEGRMRGNAGPGAWIGSGTTATVRNSTISNNGDDGINVGGVLNLVNATVAGNSGNGIGNAGVASVVHLTNAIVAGNTLPNCIAPADTSDHSLDTDGTCGVGVLAR